MAQLVKSKVIVGMSGGVDSSVAAYLLIQQAYEVEGLFMKNWEEDDGTEYCTAKEDFADAAQVCAKLGIPLRVANFAAEYWDNVFEDFLSDYKAGHTPNPDVLCNREIKFKHFAAYANTLGADFIATGHYVRWQGDGLTRRLAKAKDASKDQSYFLQAVPSQALNNSLFPLGDLLKTQVRAMAENVGLHNHQRKDSTGLCFIGERRFQDFLGRFINDKKGQTVDPQGRRLAEHNGLHNFTIGQRQGIALGGLKNRPEAPWYVVAKVAKDGSSDRLVVSQQATDLDGSWLRASEANWFVEPKFPLTCSAKIRYRQSDQACRVTQAANGELLVKFDSPQRAIANGQYIALYDGDSLLGGAKIKTSPTSALQLNF
ncbi:MAG: tRNA-specific 2-thiouridylase [Limisphaerales bacterium]